MPAGHKDGYRDKSLHTPSSSKFTIKITEREFEELRSLKDRNYAGLTIAWHAWQPVNQVIMKILEQIVKEDDLDNYDNDGERPLCKAPEHEELD